jgi:hypothetical protein
MYEFVLKVMAYTLILGVLVFFEFESFSSFISLKSLSVFFSLSMFFFCLLWSFQSLFLIS